MGYEIECEPIWGGRGATFIEEKIRSMSAGGLSRLFPSFYHRIFL